MSASVLVAAVAGALAAAAITDLAGEPRARRPALGALLLARLRRHGGTGSAPAALADRVAAAGTRLTVAEVLALRRGAAIAGVLAGLPLAALVPGRLGLLLPVAAAGAGHLAPGAWLTRRIRLRTAAMAVELADVVDLLRVAIDAGLPVRRALHEVGRRHPGGLAGELRRTAETLELGVPGRTALRQLRRRVPLPSAGPLHAALEAAERLGTPPSDALRALAADARAEQARALAEAGARAAPKIQLVVALVLVPSVLLLVAAALLPAVAG